MSQPKITHCLWFASEAEEAAKFYTTLFKGGKILATTRYTEVGHEIHGQPAGSVMTVEFEIMNQRYLALNGGPLFKPNESFSIVVNCENQDEIDYYWKNFIQGGGEPSQCGWLKDKWGFSWQINPVELDRMMKDKDPEKVKRVTDAFLKMQKFDIAALRKAFEGR